MNAKQKIILKEIKRHLQILNALKISMESLSYIKEGDTVNYKMSQTDENFKKGKLLLIDFYLGGNYFNYQVIPYKKDGSLSKNVVGPEIIQAINK